jgi:hypothetical protein
MIKKIRLKLSNLLLSLALRALGKNSGEQLLLALTLKKYSKQLKEQEKSLSGKR